MAASLEKKACFPPSIGEFSVEICEKRVALCSPEEVEKLLATIDCVDQVPACTGPQDSEFAVNFFRCEAYYSGTDADCVSALFSQN